MQSGNFAESKFMNTLEECRPTLLLLSGPQPISIDALPESHKPNLKRLERLGLVHRKNKLLELKKVHLQAVLRREARGHGVEQLLSYFTSEPDTQSGRNPAS